MKTDKMTGFKEKLDKFFLTYLAYPNKDRFDEEFRDLLQISYFFGFFQPKPSKKRMAYGAFMIVFVFVSSLLGTLRDSFLSLHEQDLGKTLVNVSIAIFTLSYIVQKCKFAFNGQKITSMIGKLSSMHEYHDEDLLQKYRQKCLKILKLYKIFVLLSLTIPVVSKLFGANTFKLAVPAIYDELANGTLRYILLIVSVIHAYCYAFAVIPCDLLNIFCLIRLEANVEFLSNKLRQCTDSDDLKENERNLIACIKYHWIIIE